MSKVNRNIESHSANGEAFFLLSDAAFICSIRPEKLRRWMAREPWSVIGPTLSTRLSFAQLIEIMYVVKLREKKVTLQNICTAHDLYRKTFRTSTPFAKEGVLLDLRRILIEDRHGYMDAVTKQTVAGHTTEMLTRIRFDSDGNADSLLLQEGSCNVIISPRILGGMPIIEGTRLKTDHIVSQVVANDYNMPVVAEIYGISIEVVKEAITFELKHAV